MSRSGFVLLLLCFVGCVSISPQQQLNFEANRALVRNNYRDAIKKYERALTEAVSNNDKQYEAIAIYGLARSYGYLCNLEEAEKWFLKSIALRETIPDSQDAYLSQNLLELARLYKSNGQYAKANSQFEKAIPLLESLDIELSDPIGYANVLEDYVFTLENSGNTEKSEKIKNRIKEIKDRYPSRRAGFVAQQYPSECN